MVNVKSLNLRIALQFAVVLLPLMALVVYAAQAELQRAGALDRAFAVHTTSVEARTHYGQFLEGAADSVDTGRLSARALDSLRSAKAEIVRLEVLHAGADPAHAELRGGLQSIVDVIAADSSTAALAQLQTPIHRARVRIWALAQAHQQSLDQAIESWRSQADRSRRWVLLLSGGLLLLTAGFIVQFSRGLSRPLQQAVDVADRIASGHKLDSFAVTSRHDVGNLLSSLRRMHASLLRYEREAEVQRHGLEAKVVELDSSRKRLDQAQAVARLGNWQRDANDAAPVWSQELYRLLGLADTRHQPTLRRFLRRLPARDRQHFAAQLRSAVERGGEVTMEHGLLSGGDEERVVTHALSAQHDSAGRLLRISGVVQDITDRREAERTMRQLALYDGLTGLANRQFFNEHLRNAVARSRRLGTAFATIFVDLDRFKRINDTLGHAVGDALLREAAGRLIGCVRETDEVTTADPDPGTGNMVARLGGDEFIVLLRDLLVPRDAVTVAQRMIDALADPFVIEGHELIVSASLGIAMYPTDGEDSESLVKAADTAMYAAKRNGRNTFQFYSEEMNSAAYEKLNFESQLRLAINNSQLVLHYQPKVEFPSGALVGMEALVRWQHPQWGLVAPSRFIPLAEELGIIAQVGDRVLEMACAQAGAWRAAGLPAVPISVNLAGPSFLKPTLVPEIVALLQRHGMQAKQLMIEATESMLMNVTGELMKNLGALREMGIELSIDDFGTGYSSLTYLRRFPVAELKVDRSFVAEMTHNADDAAIVAAIVSLGRNMKRRVVAEGVETVGQAYALLDQGCDLMQGFLFSRPVPPEQMAELLARACPFASTASRPSLAA